MQIALVLTILGKDRPGLVESLADVVAKNGGNWLESRMCRLGGEFAGILRMLIEDARAEALQNELAALQVQGLTVTVCSARNNLEQTAGRMVTLELVGQDRPGIVREISRVLARKGVNVEELSTECSSAPMSGEALFKAQAKLRLPEPCAVADLRKELERIAGNLLVEVSLEELQ
jgi:glycine cleavage system regulatory protein